MRTEVSCVLVAGEAEGARACLETQWGASTVMALMALRDPGQGPMLDEALARTLTQPSKKKGSKRTRGEEVLAERAKRARQTRQARQQC